ncbi:hypothetical protein ASF10_16610 [Flavobacterium sp. Leaf82]|jgi:uncharacterized membrane protein HdeD (DUF308 family)|uniref:hypothetical protein n=1 Tax=unclassified Flavobacterium TaxID=196869 RepID=UPI0006F2D372|nr:hypothetical protein [Flavobacterium sp. Leaf82]KQO20693.1 hypothetical protein ASF10_16610 [Flavobacterium sp. Leaf82]
MNKLYDLRFVIGVFFLIIGVLLIGYAFVSESFSEYKMKINLYCGLLFSSFGLLMLLLKKNKKL